VAFNVTLNSLGRSYSIPEGGQVDWRNDTSRYLRDAATVINSLAAGSLVTPVYNVKNYGATGNGTTDDTAAIQTAMAALALTGTAGGALYFPAGTYKYTSRLQFGVSSSQTNIALIGDGSSSILKPTGAFSTNPTIELRNCNYWHVSQLLLDASARTGTGDSLLVDGCSNGAAFNCGFSGSTRYGLNITKINGSSNSLNNVTYNVTYASNAGGDLSSTQATQQLFPEAGVRYWFEFGILANGTDESAKLQAALSFFGPSNPSGGTYGAGSSSGRFVLPAQGIIGLSSEVDYWGDVSHSIVMETLPPGFQAGQQACQLKWLGLTNTPMLRWVGANGSQIRNISFNGNNVAHDMLCLDNATVNGGGVMWGPSSFNFIEGCSFTNNGGSGCAGLRIGGVTDTQVSEVHVKGCYFSGKTDGTAAGYGIRVSTGANCKNFYIQDCVLGFHQYHADLGSSGNAQLLGCVFSACTGAFVLRGATTSIRDCEAESGTNSGDLGPCFIYDGGEPSNAQVGNSLTMQNFTCFCDYPPAGTTYPLGGGIPTTQNADIAIRAPGKIFLSNCEFVSFKPAFTFVKLCIGPSSSWRGASTGQGGSIASLANWYHNATDCVPFYDTNGNQLAGAGAGYGNTAQFAMCSFGDMGGDGTNPYALEPLIGRPASVPNLQPYASDVLSKFSYSAQGRIVEAKISLSYTDFQAAALVKNIKLATLLPGSYLRKVRAEISPAFSGTAGTLLLRCGIGSGDSKVWADTDVKSAPITIGDATADYTTGPGMGDALALGYCPDKTTNFDLYTRLTSGAGNLSGLSGGAVTFYVLYEVP
jgi:hypothetical protein